MGAQKLNYNEAHAELYSRLSATVRGFATSHGLRTPTESNLRQMDTDLPHITSQLLWFGFDVWPKGVDGDDDEAGGGGKGPSSGGTGFKALCPIEAVRHASRRSMAHLAVAACVLTVLCLTPGSAVQPVEARVVARLSTPSMPKMIELELADDGEIDGVICGHALPHDDS